MNIDINGLSQGNTNIKKDIVDYTKYLQGVVDGHYSLTEAEIELFNIDMESNQERQVSQIISNLKNYSTEDGDKFDFNLDGIVDIGETVSKDQESLNYILSKNNTKETFSLGVTGKENLPENIKNMIDNSQINLINNQNTPHIHTIEGMSVNLLSAGATNHIVVGDYMISSNPSSGHFVISEIQDDQISIKTAVWGDPHVQQFKDDGSRGDQWHYGDDASFILPNGTKITTNSMESSSSNGAVQHMREIHNGYNAVYYNYGLTIIPPDGEEIYHNGIVEGLKNTRQVQTVNVTDIGYSSLTEFDAAQADIGDTGSRNGTFIMGANDEWGELKEDGSVKDLKAETFGNYRLRGDLEMKTHDIDLEITREQRIAALDGDALIDFRDIQSLDLGENKILVENEFLVSNFKLDDNAKAVLENLASISEINKYDLGNIVEGKHRGANDFHEITKDLEKVDGAFNFFNGDTEKNEAMTLLLVNKFVRQDRIQVANAEQTLSEEDLSRINNIHSLSRKTVNDYEAQSSIKDAFLKSLTSPDYDSSKLEVQEFVFDEFFNQAKYLFKNDSVRQNAFATYMISGFMDVSPEQITDSKELLSEEEVNYVEFVHNNIEPLVSRDESHSFYDEGLKFSKMLLNARNIDYALGNKTNNSLGSERESMDDINDNKEFINLIVKFANADMQSLTKASEAILRVQDESDPSAIEANNDTLKQAKIEYLEGRIAYLESLLSRARGNRADRINEKIATLQTSLDGLQA